MSSLYRRTLLRCPGSETASLLDRLLGAAPEGDLRFALRPPVMMPRLRVEMALSHDVLATVRRAGGPELPYEVDWKPSDGGLFPRYLGTLWINGGAEGDGSSLVLEGDYETPARAGEPTLDGLIAHRVTLAIATALLTQLRDLIERSFVEGSPPP